MIKVLDTAAGDIVEISLPAVGPYGIVLAADTDGCAAVVQSFERLPNGIFGPIQRHGGVHYGDVLFEFNDRCFFNTPHGEVLRALNDKNLSKKNAKFLNAKEYYRRKSSGRILSNQDGKQSFLSTVKQTRYTEKDGKKFVEYEICCLLRVPSARLTVNLQQDQDDRYVRQWSVWKRYSEFEQLHAAMKSSLGSWQMDPVGSLPSAHRFALTNKLSPAFVEARRDELKEYWQKLLSVDKVADFSKHHCSKALKDFLEVNAQLTPSQQVHLTLLLPGSHGDPYDIGYLLLQQEFDASAPSDWLPLDPKSKSQSFSIRPTSQRVSANMRRKPSFGGHSSSYEEGSGSGWGSLLSSSRSPSVSIQSSARSGVSGGSGGGGNQEDGSGITDLPLPSRLPPPLPSCPPPAPIVPTLPPPLPPSQPPSQHSANDGISHSDSINDGHPSQLPSHPPPLVPSTPPPLPPPPPPPRHP